MWSFVYAKGDKQWIWLAIDVETREIVGVHVGDRSEEGARQLWNSLPSVCIASVPLLIPISGMPMAVFFQKNGIKLSAKKAVKSAMSSVSTVLCVRESLG
jgi:hypothetical protein